MATHFKPTIIRYTLADGSTRTADGRRVAKDTPGAVKNKHKAKKWYARLPGRIKPTPLSANKVVAQQMLAGLLNKAELGRVGIVDPFEAHRLCPCPNTWTIFARAAAWPAPVEGHLTRPG
jgi:hypothetical protein